MRRSGCAVRFVIALSLVACGSSSAPDRLIVSSDAAIEGGLDGGDSDAPVDAPPDHADASPYLGGPCVDDGQCDDTIACTYDSCDQGSGRCLNVPDDTQCDDGVYCNGQERCVVGHGCTPGPVVSCSDNDPCIISHCVESTRSCARTVRDVDQDGDPDIHCTGGHDCNDLDPNVSSLHAEVCSNLIDDNCNGQIDEQPCVEPQGDTCQTAYVVGGSGSFTVSTLGDDDAFPTSCAATGTASESAVVAVTVPPGPNEDLEVWVTSTSSSVGAAIRSTCDDATSELACESLPGGATARARAYGLVSGTYYVVVSTSAPSEVDLEVDLDAATRAPANVDCASALPIAPSTPTTVSIVDPPTNLPSACTPATGSLTYSFTLTQPEDVRVFASTVRGSGTPIVGLRDPACIGQSDELTCHVGSATPLYERALSAGTYVLTVAANAPIDASLDLELAVASSLPVDQTCAAPPSIGANATASFDLSNHEAAIRDGCGSNAMAAGVGPDAALDLSLPVASDLLLIERLPQPDVGALSLDPTDCSMTLACVAAAPSPVRVGKRNVPSGDYRVVVADELGLQGTVDALVRPTVPPVIVPAGGADNCGVVMDITGGGFFTGDTSTAQADYDNPCDAPTSGAGGAPDQVFGLNLTQAQRVVFDMEGSAYQTILDIRQGGSCPGAPIVGGCYVGAGASRSFLDLELTSGQYWIIVDGYAGQAGAWNLDVRLLPPAP